MPINWEHGGMMANAIADVWAFGVTALLWKIGKWILRKTRRNNIQAA